MRKNLLLLVTVVCVIALVSGCGTAPKKVQDEIGGIKTRVDTLESRVEGIEMKQTEAERLAMEKSLMQEAPYASTNIEIKSRTSKSNEDIKQVQIALKSAGFYNGKIDGVKGKQTKKAIKDFQREHGLAADGVVGKKTWDALAKYTYGGDVK